MQPTQEQLVARFSKAAQRAQANVGEADRTVSVQLSRVHRAKTPEGVLYTVAPLRAPVVALRVGETSYTGRFTIRKEKIAAEPEELLDQLLAGEGDGFLLTDAQAYEALRLTLERALANGETCRQLSIALCLVLLARRGIRLAASELPF